MTGRHHRQTSIRPALPYTVGIAIVVGIGLAWSPLLTCTLLALGALVLLALRPGRTYILAVVTLWLMPLGEFATREILGIVVSPAKAMVVVAWLILLFEKARRQPHGETNIRPILRPAADEWLLVTGSALIAMHWITRPDVAISQAPYIATLIGNVSLVLLFSSLWPRINRHQRATMVAILGSITIVVILTSHSRGTRLAETASDSLRSVGSYGNANAWAGLLLAVLGICWAYSRDVRGFRSAAITVSAIGAGSAMFLTYSRGALIGLGALLLGGALLRTGNILRRVAGIAAVGSLMLFVIPVFAPAAVGILGGDGDALKRRFSAVATPNGPRDNAVSQRQKSLSGTVKAFNANPVLGSGPRQYPLALEEVGADPLAAHNFIAALAVDGGVTGLAGGLFVIAGALTAAVCRHRASPTAARLAVAFLALAVAGQSSNVLIRQYFWVVAGLLVAELRVSRLENRSPPGGTQGSLRLTGQAPSAQATR